MALSPVYETEPVGVAERFAGELFLNCVVIAETALPPELLAQEIHAIEARCGRLRRPDYRLPGHPQTVSGLLFKLPLTPRVTLYRDAACLEG